MKIQVSTNETHAIITLDIEVTDYSQEELENLKEVLARRIICGDFIVVGELLLSFLGVALTNTSEGKKWI